MKKLMFMVLAAASFSSVVAQARIPSFAWGCTIDATIVSEQEKALDAKIFKISVAMDTVAKGYMSCMDQGVRMTPLSPVLVKTQSAGLGIQLFNILPANNRVATISLEAGAAHPDYLVNRKLNVLVEGGLELFSQRVAGAGGLNGGPSQLAAIAQVSHRQRGGVVGVDLSGKTIEIIPIAQKSRKR